MALTAIRRYSSRRQRLDRTFLPDRLRGARAYDRIAGYFSSSLLEVVGEQLETIAGPIRMVCNSDWWLAQQLTEEFPNERIGLYSGPTTSGLMHGRMGRMTRIRIRVILPIRVLCIHVYWIDIDARFIDQAELVARLHGVRRQGLKIERTVATLSMRKETTGGNINWVGSNPRLARTASALSAAAESTSMLLTAGTRLTKTRTVITSDKINFTNTHQ